MYGLEHYTPRDHVSISSLCTFARCPRKYFYDSGCRLRSLDEPIAREYGSAIHAGIPYAIRQDLDRAMTEFMIVWQYRDQEDDPKRNSTRAQVLLENVMSLHGQNSIYKIVPPPEGGYHLDDSVSPDELAFAVDIGLDLPFVGKVDAIGQHIHTGDYYAIEYKTTSRLGAGFLSSFNYNPQTIGYAIALTLLMGDKPVAGTIIEALGVAKTKAEILLHIANVSEQQMEEFITWARRIETQIQERNTTQEWPKYCCSCTPYPQHGVQGFRCDYSSLCQVEDWTQLKELFKVKEYDLFSSTKESK